VRYTLQLPAGIAAGSYSCAAGFTTLPAIEQNGGGLGMRVAVRIVATFYIRVGTPAIKGQMKAVDVEAVRNANQHDDQWQAVVVIENTGQMYFRPTGTLEVLDAAGSVAESLDFAPIPVLREREQRFLFPLKTRLSAASYKIRARVDLGTGELQEGTADVVLDPPKPPLESGEAGAVRDPR
jgi:hypothetical protein